MAAQPSFALHPADAIPGVINLTMREGIKLYQNPTRPFYSDPADCFNCKAPGVHGFLKEVEGRASVSAGVMLSSKSQTISEIPSGEPRISSRITVNLH